MRLIDEEEIELLEGQIDDQNVLRYLEEKQKEQQIEENRTV